MKGQLCTKYLEPTKAAKATPTPAPANAQNTTYTSKNKAVSIKLPDATWANKSDSDDMLSFESPKQGKLDRKSVV